jgi:signal peptidase I
MHEGSHELHKRDLFLDALRSHGAVRMRVLGTSMVPTIWPGDLVEVQGGCGGVLLGDIVLAMRDEAFYMHRVVRVEESTQRVRVTTRGDAMQSSDPPTLGENILGKVVRINHHGKHVEPASCPSVLNGLIAWAFRTFSPVRILLLRMNHKTTTRQALRERSLSTIGVNA